MMARRLEGFEEFRVRADEAWRIELPEGVALPGGEPVMIPYLGGTLALAAGGGVTAVVDSVFEARFGGFDSTDRRQIVLRSWLLGSACPVAAGGPRAVTVPETLRNHVRDRERMRLFVQVGGGEKPPAIVWRTRLVPLGGRYGVPLPRRLARLLGAEPVLLVPLAADSVWAFPGMPALQSYIDGLLGGKFGFDPDSPAQAQLRAFLLESSVRTEVSSRNILAIPSQMVERASLGADVVVVGAGGHVEVRNAASWAD